MVTKVYHKECHHFEVANNFPSLLIILQGVWQGKLYGKRRVLSKNYGKARPEEASLEENGILMQVTGDSDCLEQTTQLHCGRSRGNLDRWIKLPLICDLHSFIQQVPLLESGGQKLGIGTSQDQDLWSSDWNLFIWGNMGFSAQLHRLKQL